MQPQLLSGARLEISINGQAYGFGSVLSYSLVTNTKEIRCVDIPMPLELAPGTIGVSMTMQVFRSPDNDPAKQGIAPASDLSGTTYVTNTYTEFRYLQIQARDAVTDQPILFIPQAVVTRRSGSVQSEGLLEETISIVGMGFNSSVQAGLIPSITSLF